MAFFPPIPLIRRNAIIKKLKTSGATSAESAKTLAEAGVINPNGFVKKAEVIHEKICNHIRKDGK